MTTSRADDAFRPARVLERRPETSRATTFRLAVPGAAPHLAGQHYVVRLTAPDGYVAMRSYSVASAPDVEPTGSPLRAVHGAGAVEKSEPATREIELTVERLDDGEVSGYLDEVVEVGDVLDVRGPLGGWFVWEGRTPAILIGGGSGVVPLMSMLRLARTIGRSDLVRTVVSVRTAAELFYADELPGPETSILYTRSSPPGTDRHPARLGADDLAPVVDALSGPDTVAYVCGSGGFADAAGRHLVELGMPVEQIRIERFGPTG